MGSCPARTDCKCYRRARNPRGFGACRNVPYADVSVVSTAHYPSIRKRDDCQYYSVMAAHFNRACPRYCWIPDTDTVVIPTSDDPSVRQHCDRLSPATMATDLDWVSINRSGVPQEQPVIISAANHTSVWQHRNRLYTATVPAKYYGRGVR